jgi:XTP/dITP diphosphohydrolase
MKINFVTTNLLKFEIAEAYFKKLDGEYELVRYAAETPEIQDVSVEEIARQSALWAAKETKIPCITADFGGAIIALGGFPGPFVKYINDWLSQEDYLALLQNKSDRGAYLEDAMAIAYPNGESAVFSKKTHGLIAASADPENTKWPLNSLFIPQGCDRPLGKLSNEEQIEFWGDGLWPQIIDYLDQR